MDNQDLTPEQPVETSVDKSRLLFKRATALCFIVMILFGNYLLVLNLTGQPIKGHEFDIWFIIVGLTLISGLGYIFLSAVSKLIGQRPKDL